ncbi:Eco57I restriction-modification methylase domain-containing protein [Nocardiopsis protaetiae]|uniref:Eco57I restriction-modification methylase domain-containing protein n=1 Tax=Nocardiopsis protaetiae TaxID=3382270 RepID=UPI00387B2FAE
MPPTLPSSVVHSVGGLLPSDMLLRIAEGRDVPHSQPADYGVVGSGSVDDAAERRWHLLRDAWWVIRRDLPRRTEEGRVPADPTGAASRRWIEPLFEQLGFGRLAGLRIPGVRPDDEPAALLPVTHRYQHLLVHLVPWGTELGTRGPDGAPAPQSLLQEALNRTSEHLWGIVTNGRELRLLRDSHTLAGSTFVSWDLEAIFDGELVHEFIGLFRTCHASRFETVDQEPPAACPMERWREDALRSGVRALDALRENVEEALAVLGTGFLRHPANTGLRRALDVGALHGALLRLVFRILFVAVIEDRDLLHPPETDEQTRKRYATYFSFARLSRLAGRGRGGPHGDLYRALRMVLDALGDEDGRPELGLVGLGGLFTPTEEDEPLRGAALSNEVLLRAVRGLSRVRDADTGRRRKVAFRTLSSRELGAVYESLLESTPEHCPADLSFRLVHRAGNTRKMTGAYYTPSSLIERLLDSSLDPVLDDAVKRGEVKVAEHRELDPADTIAEMLLSVTVCDPACGSGHMLVAAAQRIAKRVAAVREGTPEPTQDAYREALHDVVARCLYGIDLNPMAVAVTKMALWLEGMSPGRPLDLLDPHIKHGNALVGATPARLRAGVPDAAFTPIEGDDRGIATSLGRANTLERGGQAGLFDPEGEGVKVDNTGFAAGLHGLYRIRVGSLRDVRRQERVYRAWRESAEYRRDLHIADAWCAAFFWEKVEGAPRPVTAEAFRALQDPEGAAASAATHEEILRLRERYRFFHWHLEFPDIFRVCSDGDGADDSTGWDGGFDCVLSNPPWDKLDFEDKKYFSVVEPALARISGVARRKAIERWRKEYPEAGERYRQARRRVKATLHFTSRSEIYPLCAKGLSVKGVNTLQVDQLFVELFTGLVGGRGRIGVVVPTGVATSAGAQELFAGLTRKKSIASLYDFENLKQLFPGVHASYRFCLFSLVGRGLEEHEARYAFFLHASEHLEDERRVFPLNADEIRLISPNTGSLPAFKSRKDADLALSVYRHLPVLWKESVPDGNSWRARFKNLFNMTDDSGMFRSRRDLEDRGWVLEGNVFVRGGRRMLPLYEAKMAHHFDHRWNGFGEGEDGAHRMIPKADADPRSVPLPRYWVPEHDPRRPGAGGREEFHEGVDSRLSASGWDRGWLYGWRDVCRSTDERTAIPVLLPRTGVGHTLPLMFVHQPTTLVAALYAVQSSLVFDYVSRQKINGAHMALMTWKQLPVPTPAQLDSHLGFLVPRVLELVYTAHDMEPFARDLDYDGPPFPWDEDRRATLRAELDAYLFHLYGLERDDVEHVLETFQTEKGGLKNNEIVRHGTYRTRDLVLAAYDHLASAGAAPRLGPVRGAGAGSST